MDPVPVLALGVNLSFVATGDGGRVTPLGGGHDPDSRFTYRPNWGLPGWPDSEQTAGPVLGFSRTNVHPGEQVRAIVVPLFVEIYPQWRDVAPGDVLRMYEGSRTCGLGHVRWVEAATWHMPDDEQERLVAWLDVQSTS